MKKENLKRAIALHDEISNVSKQLVNAKLMKQKQSGFIIAEFSDGSGCKVDHIYENGNYPNSLYGNIIESIISELEKHLKKLNKEVEEL